MSGERTIPLLPCSSIDEIEDFYTALQFARTYRQLRPNPYLALEREDIALHFFGMPSFDPASSYGTCLVLVPEIGALHSAFAAGLRERFGTLPVAGIPRITRPRARKNADGLTGFSIVDPGGNWIRFTATAEVAQNTAVEAPDSPLATALANAVVLGDSQGNVVQSAKILDGALHRFGPTAAAAERRDALLYRAELAARLGDREAGRAALDAASLLGATDSEIADLRRSLG